MSAPEPIAVVGLGGVFPDAPELDAFWANIAAGACASREVPEGRWVLSKKDAFDPGRGVPDKVYSLKACLIEGFRLDPEGLGLPPDFLRRLDPVFHLALHAARQAWRGARTEGVDRARVGVVIGNIVLPTDGVSALARECLLSGFEERVLGLKPGRGPGRAEPLDRFPAGLPAGVVARALGLGGGTYTLDAACASSLYALKLAMDELRSGRADAMLTGGVSRPESLYTQMGFSQLRALSASGRPSPFDAAADGLVVGEGAGMFVLKRLEDARRQGDEIHGVIAGVGLSNDVGGSLLAPNTPGQLRAMREAYRQAGWSPSEVDLVECHATGTPTGDPVEVASLKALWGERGWRPGQCALGSVKSNVGHLLTAAGAAGLMKVLLALRRKTLPPTAHFAKASPQLGLEGSPFRVPAAAAPWPERAPGAPRRAAVSAFGFGGINAHVLVEEAVPARKPAARAKAPGRASPGTPVSVAIVGMEARFGPLKGLRAFSEAVLGGKSLEPTAPDRRWWGSPEAPRFPGHYLPEVSAAAGDYRIPPKEMEEMLPQQLLMLEAAAAALEDAGLRASLPGDRTGVFIGIGLDLNTTNFHLRWCLQDKAREWAQTRGWSLTAAQEAEWLKALREAAGPALSANRTMGALGGIVASRIAREFSAGGPSFTLSSEESSGLRALEAGVRALREGELDCALVGGVDIAGDLRAVLGSSAVKPYSPTGRARPFDAAAEGAAVGEGAAALVLMRLDDALKEGRRVYATVRGLGFASGGGVDAPAPSADAYRRALERAYGESELDPSTVGFLETHGSGDPAEDRAEASALADFYGIAATSLPCALGALKAQIGHAGAASGLAGVVKAALALYQEILPPMVVGRPEEFKPLEDLARARKRFHVPVKPQYWLRNRAERPRRAGVSVMGIDGNCGHAVLEALEAAPDDARAAAERRQPLGARAEALFAVEADDARGLLAGLAALRDWAAAQEADANIEALARRWLARNPQEPDRSLGLALVARDWKELLSLARLAGDSIRENPERPIAGDRVHFTWRAPFGARSLAFVFPGSGNQFLGMGVELGAQWPEVLRRLDSENGYLRGQVVPELFAPWRFSWPEGWAQEAESELLRDYKAMIFGSVAHGVVLSDLVRQFGVRPAAVLGYSLGETAGLFALRAWTARDEMLRRMKESSLFQSDLAGPCEAVRQFWNLPPDERVDWVLGVIDRPADSVRMALKGMERAALLIVNAPVECVVGGYRKAVDSLVEGLGCVFLPLQGVSTVHFPAAELVAQKYKDLHLLPTKAPEGVRFYSGAWGRHYDVTAETAAESITAQAIRPFDFSALVKQAYEDGVRLFIELGPQGSCSRMISKILGPRPHLARSACARGQDPVSVVLRLLAQLVAERVPVDLKVLYGQESRALAHQVPAPERPMVRAVLGGAPWRRLEWKPPERGGDGGVVSPGTLGLEPRSGFGPGSGSNPGLRTPRQDDAAVAAGPAQVRTVAAGPVPRPAALQAAAPAAAAELSTMAPRGAFVDNPAEAAPSAVESFAAAAHARAAAHEAFLRLSRRSAELQTANLALQASLIQAMLHGAEAQPPASSVPPGVWRPGLVPETGPEPERGSMPSVPEGPTTPAAGRTASFMSRADCLEFASGMASAVLGDAFREADRFPTRVRLPEPPLMLVDRILSVEGEAKSLKSGRVVTEHDVLKDGWYLDGGRIPTCVAVEAGQADLFLSGYLGIDFETKGLRVYRLLDAKVTFHRGLPGPGEVIRYDIKIHRFARHGEVWLFFFSFESTVGGRPLLTMTEGCAGFFTEAELAEGRGIVLTEAERAPAAGKRPADWKALAPFAENASLAEAEMAALRRGDLAAAFGPAFAGLPVEKAATLPSGKLKLVDRILRLEPEGGRYGLGLAVGEMDIRPDDWHLVCHFKDDNVMPGTLMYECCLHTLRVFLMRLGWVGEEGRVAHEPVPGVVSTLKCRGQVLASTQKVTYELHVKELSYGPEPRCLADALMYSDGKPIVHIPDMSVRLTGTTREELERLWAGRGAQGPERPPAASAAAPALYGPEKILAFSNGKPSEAFGDKYEVFDAQRVIARLPGPPYQFLDRITAVEGQPWVLKAGARATAEYAVPEDAWYFKSNAQPAMPFAVLLEVALQPCGWLAAYCGSALTSPIDLSFRNLGGSAVQHREVTPETGLLVTRVAMTKVSSSGGMIIQNYDLEVKDGSGRLVYEGKTEFGFFTKAALAQQIGVRGAKAWEPTAPGRRLAPASLPGMPGPMLLMLDEVELVPGGGAKGLGFLRGWRKVDPAEWFFKAHFHQDPVCPGSLGLESFVQLLKAFARERWGAGAFESMTLGSPHEWLYRGQYTPVNKLVEVSAEITALDDAGRALTADGLLKADGLVIYRMKDFGLRLKA